MEEFLKMNNILNQKFRTDYRQTINSEVFLCSNAFFKPKPWSKVDTSLNKTFILTKEITLDSS